MAKTYCTCIGMRGEATRRGGNDGCRVSCQAWDGSIVVSNWYDQNDELRVRVGTNDGSGCYSDWNSKDFTGTFEEFKQAMELLRQIKIGDKKVISVKKRAK